MIKFSIDLKKPEELGLEDMTVREFVTEVLKPHIARLNAELNKKLKESK